MRIVNICTLVCALSMFGCANKQGTVIQQNDTNNYSKTASAERFHVNQKLAIWNGQQKIQLLPHQLVPIEYLESNPSIKGLLLYHYLGTGKTYTALGLIQRNPSNPVVILAPRFLQSHWIQHIKEYGVTNSERITIVTHENPEVILKMDLRNSILIIDESHKILEKISSGISLDEGVYSNLYLHLGKAHRILSLSGTPIYGKLTDIAYQVNLVSGKNDITFNEAEFRAEFLKVNPIPSYFRGHLAESIFAPTAISATSLGLAMAVTSSPIVIAAAAIGGSFIPGIIQGFYPIQTANLREFTPSPLKTSVEKYVSYYDFNNPDKKHFPTSTIHVEDVLYNKPQIDFLFNLQDSRLDVASVQKLLKDEHKQLSNDVVALNSTNIQNSIKNRLGGGQQVANMIFADPQSQTEMLYPYKFSHILDTINTKPGPTVLYSHYYYNGILSFASFLDSNGKKGKYAILHPDMSIEEHKNIISRYNQGAIEILLIHPEITEGISLLGTRQMHLLEVPHNKAFQEQIVGRVVRYKSHARLPEKERHVDVYIWKAILPRFGIENNLALRENWNNYFSELNYYSNFGQGRIQIDPNAVKKNISPDELAYLQLQNLDMNMCKLRTYLKKYSIENYYQEGVK